MKKAYVDIPEGQMHYRFTGSGEPIIMLHMSGSSSDEFEKTAELLKDKYTVYAPDFLTFGGSDLPPHLYTLEEHAKTILSFMDALSIQSAHIVGNLVGANIAVHITMLAPERVTDLLLLSFCYAPVLEEFQAYGKLPVYQPIPQSADGSHLLEMWKRTQRYGESTAVVAARTLCMHIAGENSEVLHTALFSDTDLTEPLKHIKQKTLLVGAPAEKEKLTLVESYMVNSSSMFIDDLNPFFDRKNPDRLHDIIFNFLQQ